MSRVLLIEDDPDTGDAIQTMLVKLGRTVTWAKNGREALESMRDGPAPALILTDILMPGMDGLETIQNLRSQHPEVPIIAMTGQASAPYLQAASVYGARCTLAKPFKLEALAEALAKAAKG